MKLMFLGTSSGAGKTTMAAVFCRYAAGKGYDVSPFKASNLSSKSFVTKSGGEIGIGQSFQAWASGKEPVTDMNPILMKPVGKGMIQMVLNGKPYVDISPGCTPDPTYLLSEVCKSFDNINGRSDIVVCEGSGSPVELNLMDRDIANMRIVRERRIPSLIVGDIERGGVFAAIYGTWKLVKEEDRKFLKGFIINRFRGDAEILKSGIDRIEELTGMVCLGIVPFMELKFPEEDELSLKGGSFGGEDQHTLFMKNLDTLVTVCEGNLNFDLMLSMASEVI